MTSTFKLFPLMAFTALTLSLAACDDKKDDQAAADQTAMTAPADTAAMNTETSSAAPAGEVVSTAPVSSMVQAEGATAYATAPGSSNGAVFMTLHNTGSESDRLVSASTDKAASVEIHQSSTDANGTMEMRPVDGIMVDAGQQITLNPNGYHIMLMGLTQPLLADENFNLTLNFEKGGAVTVPVTVTAAGTNGAAMSTGGDASASGAMSGSATSGSDMGAAGSVNDSGTASDMSDTGTTGAGASGADAATGTSGSASSAAGSSDAMSGTTGSSSSSSYGSTMSGEAMDSSPSAATDTPSATGGATGQ